VLVDGETVIDGGALVALGVVPSARFFSDFSYGDPSSEAVP
jgi:hypothetical protein